MKTKLLKMALCAVALLPMGAWAQTWDFTSWSDGTISDLNADANWSYTARVDGAPDNDGRWDLQVTSAGLKVELTANGNAIAEFAGLKFDYRNANNRLRVDNRSGNKQFYMAGSTEIIYIPLTAGKKVSIKYRTSSGSTSVIINSVDSRVIPYNQAEAGTTERTDDYIVSSYVSSAVEVGFRPTNAVNIKTITITDASEEELTTANETAYDNYITAATTKFGEDAYVANTTLWTFDQYQANDTPFTSMDVMNYQGLYMRTGNAVSTKISKTDNTPSFGDKTLKVFSVLNMNNGREATGSNASNKASGINTYQYAINAAVPGTLYVYAKIGSERVFDIAFDGTRYVNASYADDSYKVYTYTSNAAGAFVFSATGAYYVAAVKFVPVYEKAASKVITMSDMGVMTFSDTHAWTLPAGLKAYLPGSPRSNGTLSWKAELNSGEVLPACTGAILKGSPNVEYTLTSADANMNSSIDKNYCMRPVVVDYALQGENIVGSETTGSWSHSRYNYILAKAGESMVLAKSTGEGTLAAGKSYYSIRPDQVPAGVSARLTFGFEDEDVTGITQVQTNVGAINEVYNLNGQRVAQPVKGLYIVNGKKVIIK